MPPTAVDDGLKASLPIDIAISLAIKALTTTDEGVYFHTHDAALNALNFLLSLVASDSAEAGYLGTYIQRLCDHHPQFVQTTQDPPQATCTPSATQNALHIYDILHCILSHIAPDDPQAQATYLACSQAWSAFREPAQSFLWRHPPPLDTPNRQARFMLAHLLSSTGHRATRGLGVYVREIYLTPSVDFNLICKILAITPNLRSLTLNFSKLPPKKTDTAELSTILRSMASFRSLTLEDGFPFRNLGNMASPAHNIPLPPRLRLYDLLSWLDFTQCGMNENVRNFGVRAQGKSPIGVTDLAKSLTHSKGQITALTITGTIIISDSAISTISRLLPRLEAFEFECSGIAMPISLSAHSSSGMFRNVAAMEHLRILFVWCRKERSSDDVQALVQSKAPLEAMGFFGLQMTAEQLRAIVEARQSTLRWLEVDQAAGVPSHPALLKALGECPHLMHVGCPTLMMLRKGYHPPAALRQRLGSIDGIHWMGDDAAAFSGRGPRKVDPREMFDKLVDESDWTRLV